MRRDALKLLLAWTGGVLTLAAAAARPAFAATVDVLNDPVPGTDRVVVVQGEPVEVYFEVDPAERPSPSDQIQLRRIDDGDVVSYVVRGDELQGTVSLSTTPGNALGWLEVTYALHPTGVVLATSPQKVLVTAEAPPEPPARVEVPSLEAPTLQAAIDLVADGGTVEIAAGVYNLDQPILIIGKNVTIQGAGSSRKLRPGNEDRVTSLVAPSPTEVVDAELAMGDITYIGSGGVLKDLDLSGGDACVVARDLEGTAQPLVVEDVCLSNTGRGILYQASADLTVQDAAIHDGLWNGISFAPRTPALLNVMDIMCEAFPNVGILIKYSGGFLNNVFVAGNDGGGIVAWQSPWFGVVHSTIQNNCFAGIRMHESTALIQDNLILWTHPRPSDGFFGDGIDAFLCPHVVVVDNLIIDSARAGVANFGSSMWLGGNKIKCAGYELEGEHIGGVSFSFLDLGGNGCGCPIAAGVCVAVSAGLEPPEPVAPFE